jgi:hypothetical protein
VTPPPEPRPADRADGERTAAEIIEFLSMFPKGAAVNVAVEGAVDVVTTLEADEFGSPCLGGPDGQ